jgi:hypothetical protein
MWDALLTRWCVVMVTMGMEKFHLSMEAVKGRRD